MTGQSTRFIECHLTHKFTYDKIVPDPLVIQLVLMAIIQDRCTPLPHCHHYYTTITTTICTTVNITTITTIIFIIVVTTVDTTIIVVAKAIRADLVLVTETQPNRFLIHFQWKCDILCEILQLSCITVCEAFTVLPLGAEKLSFPGYAIFVSKFLRPWRILFGCVPTVCCWSSLPNLITVMFDS